MAPSQKTRKASLNLLGTTDRTVSFLFFRTNRTQRVPTVQRLWQRLPTTVHTTDCILHILIKAYAQLQLLLTLTTPARAGGIAKRHTPPRHRRAIGHPSPRRPRDLARVGLRHIGFAQSMARRTRVGLDKTVARGLPERGLATRGPVGRAAASTSRPLASIGRPTPCRNRKPSRKDEPTVAPPCEPEPSCRARASSVCTTCATSPLDAGRP